MDFTQALAYPYKSIAKVFTIVLVMTIAFAVFLGMVLNSFDWFGYIEAVQYTITYELDYIPFFETPSSMFIPGLIGLFVVMVVQGFWLSGYSIRVIRATMDGYDKLPNIQFGTDMRKGFSLFLASILYGILFMIGFIIFGALMAMFAGPNSEGGLAFVLFCGAFIIGIPLVILIGWAFLIGMARYAAEGNNTVLFQIGTNMSIARKNVKASLSLTGYHILLGLTYWFASQFLINALDFVSSPFIGEGYGQLTLLVAVLLPFMISMALNVFQQFSSMHLIAQFAYKIGIYDDFDEEFDML